MPRVRRLSGGWHQPAGGVMLISSTSKTRVAPARKTNARHKAAKITALACKGNYTIAAAGGRISVSHRAHLVHWWPGHKGDVLQLLLMGSLIVSLGTDAYLRVWDLDNRSDDPVVRYSHSARLYVY